MISNLRLLKMNRAKDFLVRFPERFRNFLDLIILNLFLLKNNKKLHFYFIFILGLMIGCRESEKQFNTHVEITRMDFVNLNAKNEPITIDIEVSYHECPGNQFEVIRGDAEFAQCIINTGKKIGDKFLVDIEWKWNPMGYYKWFIVKLDSCERKVDPLDEVSFDLVEECEDYKVYGNVVGFTCRRIPSGNLIKACPWFRRN